MNTEGRKNMIDEKHYELLEFQTYEKTEAYERIKLMYGTMKGVTTYPAEDGKYYIVQSKVIAKL